MCEEMKKFYLECDCHSNDHTVWFLSDKDEKYGDDLYIHTSLQTHHGFWKRVRIAFRYVFRKDYLNFPYIDLMISERNNDKIRELVKFLQEHVGDEDKTVSNKQTK